MTQNTLTARSSHPLASKGGRTPAVKATPELVAAACADVRKGLTIEAALVRQGIAPTTMEYWRKKNPAVEMGFKRAEADFEEELLQLIRVHAAKDAKAAQWLLERRARGTWLPPTLRAEVTGKDGGPIQALTISKTLMAQVASAPDVVRPVKVAMPATKT